MNKKLNLEELKELVFNQNQTTKQNKDRLFKLAKSSEDIETIEKLANNFEFKSAKMYLDKMDKLSVNDAIKNRDINLLQKIIGKEADLSKINLADLLKKNYSFEFINTLIKYGTSLNSNAMIFIPSIGTKLNLPILHIAALKNNIDLMKLLLKQNISIDSCELDNRFTPLMIAVWYENIEMVEFLINEGANTELKDTNGVTPLIRAAGIGNINIVTRLIEASTDVNAKDIKGGTAIEDAYFMKHFNIVDLLLKNGAFLDNIDEFRHNDVWKENENTISICFQKVLETIKSDYIAKQFVLEELDSANKADTKESLYWINQSGYKNKEFENSMSNSLPEVDGPYGPQQTLNRLQLKYFADDFTLSSQFRREIIDRIMKEYSLGKYKNIEKQLTLENQDVITINKEYIEYKNNKFDKILPKKYFNSELQQYIELNNDTVVIYKVDYDNEKSKNYIKIAYERELTPEIILEDAVTHKDIELLKKAFEKGANAKELNIIQFIVENYDDDFIKILIQNYAQLNTTSKSGHTALMAAIEFEKKEIAKFLIEKGLNCTAKASDNGEESDTALTIACNKNDLETNSYIDIIKLILSQLDKISIYEASHVDRLLFNPEIAKCAALILVKQDNGCEQTLLMHIIDMQGSFLLNSFDSIWEISTDKSDSLKNDKQEYLNKILFVSDNLIKGGVDINYECNGQSALTLATELNLKEIIDLIQKSLQGGKHLKNGFISFDKYFINIIENKVLMNTIINDKPEVMELNQISNNTFKDKNNCQYLIDREKVIKIDQNDNSIEFIVKSYSGNIFDLDSSHDPEALSNILKKFSSDERLRYTNHPWTDTTYKNFYQNLYTGWNEIKDNIEVLSSTLFRSIDNFLFCTDNNDIISFSSDTIKEQLESGNKKPDLIKELSKSINTFKQSILIKNDENQKLLDLFARVLDKSQLDLDLDLEDIEDFTGRFYTDVRKLEEAIELILKDINKIDSDAEIKVIADSYEDLITLKIIHKGSTYNNDSKILLKTIGTTGNFTSIHDALKSVCHWDVEAKCTDGVQTIHYLYPQRDGVTPYADPKSTEVEGFTHILRFYK